MTSYSKLLALWGVIFMIVIALVALFSTSGPRAPQQTLAFRDMLDAVGHGQITDVTLPGHSITGHFKDGRGFSTYAPADGGLFDRLRSRGVNVIVAPPDERGRLSLLTVVVTWVPMLLLVGVWIFFMRRMRSRAAS